MKCRFFEQLDIRSRIFWSHLSRSPIYISVYPDNDRLFIIVAQYRNTEGTEVLVAIPVYS